MKKIVAVFITILIGFNLYGESSDTASGKVSGKAKDPYELKERVASAEIILTGKMLYIGCFDENLVELKPEGPCTSAESKNSLRYSLRTDELLKGRTRFLKEYDLRQKAFFYSKVDEEIETEIKNGQEKIFFFKSRDLDPDNRDGVNYVPLSEKEKVMKLIEEQNNSLTN